MSRKREQAVLHLFQHFAMTKTSKNKDFAYAMTPLKIFSWPVGIWPLEANSTYSFVRFVGTIICVALGMIIVYVELCLNHSNVEDNIYALILIFTSISTLTKMTYFRIYFFNLLFNFVSAKKDYDDLNDEKKRAIMRRHAYMGRLMCIALIGCANVCSMFLSLIPALDKSNEDTTSTESSKFPMPSEHIVTMLKLPESLYVPIVIVEYAMLLLTSAANLGTDLLFFGIVFHLCGQAEILQMEFNQIYDKNGRTTENLHLLIKRHCYLLKLSDMLNDTISSALIMQLMCSCILICSCEFQCILVLQGKNVMKAMGPLITMAIMMIELLAYSYVGDYLKRQMDGIGFSLYSCNWYNLPSNVVKEIMFVIVKAQSPVNITAGKFLVVNLETFTSILKASMSCLSVLRMMMMNS